MLNHFPTASTGGLLGLFMGFSVVSLIEIIYFGTLRPYCAHRRQNAHGGKDEQAVTQMTNTSKADGAWYVSGAATPIKVAKTGEVMMVLPNRAAESPKGGETSVVEKPTGVQAIGQRWRDAIQWLTSVLYLDDRLKRAVAGREQHRYPYTE